MNGKDLFKIWAPSAAERWTRFAKPALFVHIDMLSSSDVSIHVPSFQADAVGSHHGKTAVIVDLPGTAGIENGLGLAQIGFRPIPLYNGIHETMIGGLKEVVENAPIVDALVSGSKVLNGLSIDVNAPPVFLLDYNRGNDIIINDNMYDNRWSIDIDDMPDASYMLNQGIEQLVIWTEDELRKDLIPIIDSYRDMGIEIRRLSLKNGGTAFSTNNINTSENIIPSSLKENVRRFENARFGLMFIAIIALVNFFFMFFIWEQPLLWTSPTFMWLTYLWVPEIVGDIIAVAMVAGYLILYLLSQRKRKLMVVASFIFGVEAAVLYLYALYYGLASFTGYSSFYGFIVFGFPILGLISLIKGAIAWKNLKDTSSIEYYAAFDDIDDDNKEYGSIRRRRRHFRGYRGYGGYGGSGFGGYKGSGYRGYGGGFGGGFGG